MNKGPLTGLLLTALASCAPIAPAKPLLGEGATLTSAEVEARVRDSDLPPPPPLPAAGKADFVLEDGAWLDHETKLLSISCSAGSVQSYLQAPVRAYLEAQDRDGNLAPAPGARTVYVKGVQTLGRSYTASTFRGEVRFEVRLQAVLRREDGTERDISFEKDMTGAGGFVSCHSISRALSIVNLHVAAELAGLAIE